MSGKHDFRGWLFMSVFLVGCGLSAVNAQLQYPGKPVGDYRKMSAAEVIYLLPPVDPLQVEAAILENREKLNKPFTFALERTLQISPQKQGGWTREGETRVWRVHIISPDACSMGLLFTSFRLRKGVRVMVYDPQLKHVKGAYTDQNNKSSGVFAVGHLPGDAVIVELQVSGEMDDYGELVLGSVSHAFLTTGSPGFRSSCAGEYGCSQPCEIDVSCQEGMDWQSEKRSVVRINTLTQYCTGVMVNNTSCNGDPLLLTAKHCIDREIIAERTVFEFNYESPSCFGPDGSLDRSVSGAQLLAVGDSLDFSLVRLSETPPDSFGTFYAGWDLSDGQVTGTTVVHHPEGDVKKISFDFESPVTTVRPEDIPSYFWEYYYDSFWWVKQWDIGSTEAGSSGSPLFNSDRRIIGLLSFGSAECGDSIGFDAGSGRVIFDKSVNRDDFFTRLDMAWDREPEPGRSLESWLDPGNTGVSQLDGYHPSPVEPLPSTRRNKFALYPNPAGEMLYLSDGERSFMQAEFRINDLAGRLCLTGITEPGGTVAIHTGGLAPGIYLLQILSGDWFEIHQFVLAP
jgi:hypothetical protein